MADHVKRNQEVAKNSRDFLADLQAQVVVRFYGQHLAALRGEKLPEGSFEALPKEERILRQQAMKLALADAYQHNMV